MPGAKNKTQVIETALFHDPEDIGRFMQDILSHESIIVSHTVTDIARYRPLTWMLVVVYESLSEAEVKQRRFFWEHSL